MKDGFEKQILSLEAKLKYKWEKLGKTLQYECFEDYEAVDTVIKMSRGNFRLVERLFSQIKRIMEINHLDKITTEVCKILDFSFCPYAIYH